MNLYPVLQWKDCIKVVSKVHSLQELGDYWRFLWELSASCPVPYVDATALPEHLVKAEQARLLGYQFRVVVDGRQLFKPVCLADNPGGYTVHRLDRKSLRVYGRNVTLHGYIAVQEGAQLKPDELRGVLVRIKDVAIGYYDPSMLDYRINEGPRSRWLTGELFVEEGLEDALNIDRDSFNRVHPDFRAVQAHLHEILKGVFSEVWKKIDIRSGEKAKKKTKARRSHLGRVIAKVVESRVTVKTDKAPDELDTPKVSISDEAGQLEVKLPEASSLATKKSNRELAASILAVFEVAMREKTIESRREVFSELLLDLLSEW